MAKDTRPQTFDAITQEMYDGWEAKYASQKRTLKAISIPLETHTEMLSEEEEGEARFVIVQPHRTEINALTSYLDKKDYDRGNNLLINSCVLGGDMEHLKDDDDVFYAVLEEVGKLIAKKKARSISFSKKPSKGRKP